MYHRHLSSHRDRSDWGIPTVLLVISTPCGDHCMEFNMVSMRLSAQLPQFYVLIAGNENQWQRQQMIL